MLMTFEHSLEHSRARKCSAKFNDVTERSEKEVMNVPYSIIKLMFFF